MEALVNGIITTVKPHSTLQDLIVLYKLKPEVVIIEYNGNIIKQLDWTHTFIKEKDTIELISFVGGG